MKLCENEMCEVKILLTELVAGLEAGLLGPGVVGLGAGGWHGPAVVAADGVLGRAGAGHRRHESRAGENQARSTRSTARHG